MKKKIVFFLTTFCVLLALLITKTSPKKTLTHHHWYLDSAVLYAFYHTGNTEKIAFPPSFLTSFLQKKNSILTGYYCKPSDTIGFFKYYQSLPSMIKNILDRKLIGIYFYDNLLVDGLLHTVYGMKEHYYVIVCDKNILSKNLSEYLSTRESKRFVKSDYSVKIHFTDTVLNALFYVLLHECFHIFDKENNISTQVEDLPPFITKFWKFPTVPQDSTFNNHYAIGVLYNKFDNSLIDSCLVVSIYTELSKGYFASYYSTASFQEDVAEYLTLYYLTQHLNSKYEIEIRKNEKLLLTFKPFENRQLLERFNDFPKNIQLSFN